jgi:hypothetical protein
VTDQNCFTGAFADTFRVVRVRMASFPQKREGTGPGAVPDPVGAVQFLGLVDAGEGGALAGRKFLVRRPVPPDKGLHDQDD